MRRFAVLILFLFISLDAKKVDRSISYETYDVLQKVQEQLGASKESEALVELNKLLISLKDQRASEYEIAFVNRMIGFVYISMENYKSAIQYFELAIKGDLFELKDKVTLYNNVAQLYLALNEYKKSIDYYEALKGFEESINPKLYVNLASAYTQIGNTNKAIENINIAINNAEKPELGWYEMLLGLYYSQEDYTNSIKTQTTIIKNFGIKKSYLLTLSALYQYIGDNHNALINLESAYDMELLEKDDEYIRLAYMFIENQTPQKAIAVLEDGLKKGVVSEDKITLKLLADGYNLSREYDNSIIYFKKLASLTNDGNIFAMIGQNYIQKSKFKEAIEYFEKALQTEDIKNIGGVYLLMGIAHSELDDNKNAKQSFTMALKYEKTKEAATEWLKHINRG